MLGYASLIKQDGVDIAVVGGEGFDSSTTSRS